MRYDLIGTSPATHPERREFGWVVQAIQVGMEWIADGWSGVQIRGQEGLYATESQIRELHRAIIVVHEGAWPPFEELISRKRGCALTSDDPGADPYPPLRADLLPQIPSPCG